jgi:SAM-dependent methyltransferase
MLSRKNSQWMPGYAFLRKLYRRTKLKNKPAEQVFSQIYEHNIWGNAETVSGDGSTLVGTEILRAGLKNAFENLRIRSILDIPCGDFNWMKEIDLNQIKYTGADIVKALVELNQKKYANPGVQFKQLNLLEDILPAADLIFCKDCLVHFSLEDVKKALKNIINTPATYVAFTTFPGIKENKNILTGEWRPLNLEIEPFNFPPPKQLWSETPDGDKCLGIWEMEGLK